MVLIVIHGANRNADDYFCAATAAVELQTQFRIEEVLVLAPRFLVPSDLPPSSRWRQQYLQWEDTPNGPWRYGANAIQPAAAAGAQHHNTNISSFAVLDAMIDSILQSSNFSNLQHVSIAGHSSGGQFVQRWALLSPSFRRVRSTPAAANLTTMRAVVANPSSYAYLTPLRWCSNDGRVEIARHHGVSQLQPLGVGTRHGSGNDARLRANGSARFWQCFQPDRTICHSQCRLLAGVPRPLQCDRCCCCSSGSTTANNNNTVVSISRTRDDVSGRAARGESMGAQPKVHAHAASSHRERRIGKAPYPSRRARRGSRSQSHVFQHFRFESSLCLGGGGSCAGQ